jgi:subtilase family serine protease
MRVPRFVVVTSGVAMLTVVPLATAGAFVTGSTALSSPAAISPTAVLLHPGEMHAGSASAKPPTTAQCEAQFQVACYVPAQIQQAYNLPTLFFNGINGKGETIVIVDSYGSPTINHDLKVFDQTFGIPAPPSLNVIQPAGPVPTYKPDRSREGWAGETNLDVEYAHTMAPDANILLVETPTSEDEGTTGFPQIVQAEEYVIDHKLGDVISQSFSATEQSFPSAQSLLALRGAYVDAHKHNVTVLAASGDSGAADVGFNGKTYYSFPVTSWPDSDPLVTGVGGTQLHLDANGNHTAPDNVWNDTYNVPTNNFIFGSPGPDALAGGGGKSVIFSRPSYQNGVQSVVGDQRGVPDISMSGACNGGVDTYQSFPGQKPGWYPTCGTSESTPLFAGIVALADQVAGHGLGLINPALYELSASGAPGIVDVTKGNNTVSFPQGGKLETVTGFPALPGYDLASGVGTVNAALFVPELAHTAR